MAQNEVTAGVGGTCEYTTELFLHLVRNVKPTAVFKHTGDISRVY